MAPSSFREMELTIVIVSWNTRDLLRNCLRSIELSRGGLAVQTIVVDNKSADGSSEMVAQCFPDVLLIHSGGNLGFARGNNLALPHIRSPLVLFLNPDTEIHSDALGKFVEFMKVHPEVGGLGCKIRDVGGTVQPLGLQWFPSPWRELVKYLAVSDGTYRRRPRFFPYHDPAQSGYVKKLFGACLLVRKSVLDQVGSFDERFFMYCEDVDLCQRILDAGWKLYYLGNAEILHLGASASSQAPGTFAVLMSCESLSSLMRKYYGPLGAMSYRLLTFIGAQARLLMLGLLHVAGWFRPAATPVSRAASARKYLLITQWTLGLKRPLIRN